LTIPLTSISSNILKATPTSLNSKHRSTRLLSQLWLPTSKSFWRPEWTQRPTISWAITYFFRPNWDWGT